MHVILESNTIFYYVNKLRHN